MQSLQEFKSIKEIIKKTKKNNDKINLLGKTRLDTIEVLSSKALINSYIFHNEFVSVNNVLRKDNEMKEEINNAETLEEYSRYKQRNV